MVICTVLLLAYGEKDNEKYESVPSWDMIETVMRQVGRKQEQLC